eukprot:TRINITY_DN8454_c0_g1_i1.p1 TRINITY_DN8454_c0_g1~~TRINITY_DN8454_c0_g1_i1.p1  ORF type:complete len:359 (+),score=40.43 TRINITY_DN8454_c0_g1_i1:47-1123(+)
MTDPQNFVQLRFSAPMSQNKLLLEVSDEVLNEILQNEMRVCFKGKKDQEVVLCTSSKTFSVKHADSSNSIFLIDSVPALPGSPESEPYEIDTLLHHHLELKQIAPQLNQLRTLLSKRPFSVHDRDPSRRDLYSDDQLESLVQASSKEIASGLSNLRAFLYEGCWRILSDDSLEEIAEAIQPYTITDSTSSGQVELTRIRQYLHSEGFPSVVVEHILAIYFEVDPKSSIGNLKLSDFARTVGTSLLRSKPSWESADFLSSWEAKLPSGAFISLDLLAGLFLSQEAGSKLNISYFPDSKLSLLPQTRFKELFAAKPKWRLNEIKPFLKDLLGPGVTEEQLLLAHSRISTGVDGAKLYSAR